MSNESLPITDDVQNSDPTEQDLLDAVMRSSPMMEDMAPPLPTEEEIVEDPAESDEEVEDPESEEVVSEEIEEEVEEEAAETEGEDDTSTQDPEVYSADDLDLDAKVSVKIDGEDVAISFGDLIKGYSTEQSLSAKGRELGEARKALDEERTAKLGELESLVNATNSMMSRTEEALAKQYHNFEEQINKARAEGDTYELSELKDKREQVQARYWQARQQREGLMNQAAQQYQAAKEEQFQQQIEHFAEVIPSMIPDFSEEVAGKIRDFAIEEGIDAAVLDTITDPTIVKFVDDYRRLKQNVSKGTAKRKAAPVKKRVPAKKATPAKKKQEDKAKMVKARAFREDASQEDQMDFLRQYASKSLSSI